MLDGTGTAQQWAEEAAKVGQQALALTDHGTLSGILHHMHACEAAGIQPVAGVEAYFKANRLDKTPENRDRWHMVLLAKNIKGWKNLLKISSEAFATGFYYKPTIDWDLLEKYNEGLILSTACVGGWTARHIMDRQDIDGMRQEFKNLQRIFGDRLYAEIMPHGFPEQVQVNIATVNLAMELGIPLVATNDAHYPYEDWADTQDILLMINTQQSFASRREAEEKGEDVYKFGTSDLYLCTEEDMRNKFAANHPDIPKSIVEESIANTELLVSTIDHFEVSREPKLPSVRKAMNRPGHEIIREWCEEGLIRIGKESDETYRAQMEHELSIFTDKGIHDYFVIIGDVVRWAKSDRPLPGDDGTKRPIRVGLGRGSAAGSLVCYLCDITGIDPLAHGLLFERFLNPHRAEMPDVDLDFQHDKRWMIKEYFARKYGRDHVAEIVAHSTFGARSTIRDVCRVWDVPFDRAINITANLDDQKGDLGLEQIAAVSKELREFKEEFPDAWKHALRLEGQVRGVTKHAAGVVITDEPITEHMPLMLGNDGNLITAWAEQGDFPIIGMYGFLKIDVLGIRGLTTQDYVLQAIEDLGETPPDIDHLPFASDPNSVEPEVIQAFGQNMTLGVFQFEGKGITGLLKQIKPTFFGDLVAANALYRPGPLESGIAFSYGARKNGKEAFDYWHPSVKPFLEETYGILTYQEQVILLSEALAGFSKAEADTVRKALTKWSTAKVQTNKGRQELEKIREKWLDGCREKSGLTFEVSDAIWDSILNFCMYSFNKAHAAGYAGEAYQDMYLKVHYPIVFYSALLTSHPDKVHATVREATARGVAILPPDIVESKRDFSVVVQPDGTQAIRWGLAGIKYVGDAALEEIEDARARFSEEHGRQWESFDEFFGSIRAQRCNSRVREHLALAGAFDRFGHRDDWDERAKIEGEKLAMGITLIGDMLIREHSNLLEERLFTEEEIEALDAGDGVVVGGEITGVKFIKSRKNQDMCFLDVAWGTEAYNVTAFAGMCERYGHLFQEGNVLLISGSKDGYKENAIIMDNCCTLRQLVDMLEEEANV